MDAVKTLLQIVALVMVVVLVLYNVYTGATIQRIGVPGLFDIEFGRPGAQAPVAPAQVPAAPPQPATSSKAPEPPAPSQPSVRGEPTPGLRPGCRLTITNKLVPLMKDPDRFSQELVRVNPSDYNPLDYKVVNFGGLKDQGWFQIEAAGRRGWIADDTWTVASKAAACP